MVYISGEKPAQGAYQCKECGSIIKVDKESISLPLCPHCDNVEFTQI